MPVARNHSELSLADRRCSSRPLGPENAAMLATCANIVRRAGGEHDAVAPHRWQLVAASSLRSAVIRRAMPRRPLRPVRRARRVLASRIEEAGLLEQPSCTRAGALARPRTASVGAAWQHSEATMIDVLAFGEIGIVAGRRGAAGHPVEFRSVAVLAPRGLLAIPSWKRRSTPAGTLALRGPMVPRHPFPARRRGPMARFAPDADGFADTLFSCRANRDSCELLITAPPPGIVSVGGYRFVADRLQELVAGPTVTRFSPPCPTARRPSARRHGRRSRGGPADA